MLKTYGFSIAFSVICAVLGVLWGHHSGMGVLTALWLLLVLSILEISLSFDNAVVNAAVLRTMTPFWQRMFLTVGILIAVFGMRLVFPIVIVAVITGMGSLDVVKLALDEPAAYGKVLNDAYPMIATFGGAFLFMVFLKFMLNPVRNIHWLKPLEVRFAKLGRLHGFAIFVALLVVTVTAMAVDEDLKYKVLLSGMVGIVLFVAIDLVDQLFAPGLKSRTVETAGKMGFSAFLYLEVLDASFSFDGVVGAFAVSRDVVIIMLGLAIGAMFVRSITIDLVKRGVLQQYVYLEHGAHYAVGVLACIMFIGTQVHVPEVFTGLLGVAFVVAAYGSSIRHRKAG
ncbi:MAG: DUF475 domain-containing protein [Gammaproteobacteria bacterium]|nr:DUF475 domain-containing protein [Gammaproteobacteria bacterium]MBU1529580.1 DUF475 domain-containing protein [Gammaproteobacteria bacterium]